MTKKDYLSSYKNEFESTHHLMRDTNHQQHNVDPEYWNLLLREVKQNRERWKNKNALDFGCGCGRNIKNLLDLADWNRVDGCDISGQNAAYAKEWVSIFYDPTKVNTWESPGDSIQPAKENEYDFIMSHIVFQHISNYSVRFSILKDIYHSLTPDGLASMHYMDLTISAAYYENCKEYKNSRVENPQYLIDDFEKIGFKNIECLTGIDFFTKLPSYYIKGTK